LDQALKSIQKQNIPGILVGFEHADDAGVYLVSKDLALVQTIDFFSPVVDDAFVFGQIAAANALSDIYAMGGTPLTALSVVGFPESGADPEILGDIMRGGLEKLNEAGVALLGGHSVRDEEIKFGYAVTGTIDPRSIRHNGAARVGDRVVLTKQLGTGLVATALKRGEAEPAHVAAAVDSMLETNERASAIVAEFDVAAMTDISGFGLVGHAVEVARASDLTMELDHAQLPVLPGALEYSAKGCRAGGLDNNCEFFGPHVSFKGTIPKAYEDILFDPQTSGGLLIFVSERDASELLTQLRANNIAAVELGSTADRQETCVVIS
jgi:selenide,water dikinase